MTRVLYSPLLCFLSIASQAQNAEQKYETFVRDNKCKSNTSRHCLKETSYVATRGDGGKVKIRGVYDWVGEDLMRT
jgi:hypothetical protein